MKVDRDSIRKILEINWDAGPRVLAGFIAFEIEYQERDRLRKLGRKGGLATKAKRGA